MLVCHLPAVAGDAARGRVFDDRNQNGRRDAGEPGIASVRVSNGVEVVVTDDQGRYELPITDDAVVFVIKPRNWMTRIDELNLPKFWYVHKPEGSPKHLKYPGVSPTGPLPESIDFPLHRSPEPDRFDVVVFGDPQPRNVAEINYLARDVVREVIGVQAAFGVSLGDIMFDNLSLYPPYNQVMSRIGIPWHNVHGNHDMNYDVKRDNLADETWERVYGPPTYAFDYGPVHFIAIDSVMYDGHIKRGKYHAEFGRHLRFIENDLKHVPKETLIVLMMHIPLIEATDRAALFRLIEDRPHTLSLAAHWHQQQHFFLDKDDGWGGEKPHHLLVHATACGSWWSGAPNEFGVPHATMEDGAPNGYSIITFDRREYSIRFKAAGRPADHQMTIFAPDEVSRGALGQTEVVVNVFAGSDRSTVQMRVASKDAAWQSLEKSKRKDPLFLEMKKLESSKKPPPGRKLPGAADSSHIWVGRLPSNLPPGPHVIEVRTTDLFGRTYTDRRVIRVK